MGWMRLCAQRSIFHLLKAVNFLPDSPIRQAIRHFFALMLRIGPACAGRIGKSGVLAGVADPEREPDEVIASRNSNIKPLRALFLMRPDTCLLRVCVAELNAT